MPPSSLTFHIEGASRGCQPVGAAPGAAVAAPGASCPCPWLLPFCCVSRLPLLLPPLPRLDRLATAPRACCRRRVLCQLTWRLLRPAGTACAWLRVHAAARQDASMLADSACRSAAPAAAAAGPATCLSALHGRASCDIPVSGAPNRLAGLQAFGLARKQSRLNKKGGKCV